MATTYINVNGKSYEADKVTSPTTRIFREAWVAEGDVISVDIVKAREIHKDNLRSERIPLFEALDTDFMKALENGTVTDAIAAEKQKLRDVTSDSRIEAASTPEELEALTLSVLTA